MPHAKQTQIFIDLGLSFSNKRINVVKKCVYQVKSCPVKIDITQENTNLREKYFFLGLVDYFEI